MTPSLKIPSPHPCKNYVPLHQNHAHFAHNPNPKIVAITLNPLFHSAVSFDPALTTITKPTININSVSIKDISTSNFDSHKAQPQEDPRNHAILGKTMNMDDDDDNSEYMGESKNVMESFEKDISLDDENAIDVIHEASLLI